MSPIEFRAPILDCLKAMLRPLGFEGSRASFSRVSEDVVHLIDVQGSRANTAGDARFTVNVGVFASELVYPDVRDETKPSISVAHWRTRLGFLSPESTDLWWSVRDTVEAQSVAAEMVSCVTAYALPALAKLPNLAALVALWRSGNSPGITEHQRQEYLTRLGIQTDWTENDG